MTIASTITLSPSSELLAFVERESGQRVLRCYQCGKCSAGCPTAYVMDLTPRQVMRAIQFGLKDEVLKSSTIWLCLCCQVCSVRCPQQIDVARVMRSLRLLALMEEGKPGEKDVRLFHRLLLSTVRRFGRVYELGLGASYNLFSGHFLANLALLPPLLSKGKLLLLPPKAEAKGARVVFDRVRAAERKERR